ERHHDERFFLYVDTWDPHEPWDAPEYYTKQYREEYAGEQLYPNYGKYEDAGLSADDVALAHATYCGEVTMVDFWIGRLLAKLDALGLRDNTLVFFTSDHGFYFGEHGYFGKAEWVHEPGATVSQGSELPAWLADSWLLTVGWSPLYRELTGVPLIVRGPGLEAGRRSAMTTAPDIAPTILDLVGVELPATMTGETFGGVLTGEKDEHRPFVVSSWPLYFAEGEITTAVDARPRRIQSYMPLTVTTPERTLIVGGPDDEPELYDMRRDPGEQHNVWGYEAREGLALIRSTLAFLEEQGTTEEHTRPRWAVFQALAGVAGGPSRTEARLQQGWADREAG
ncbi:MAG TPA: sulfatase-like hydrolase/transferase, partial [Rubrobacteraceae bacterium]|nr:sulfatase-like hydrolase/transferase [Rubrobacteraceae bacterium]